MQPFPPSPVNAGPHRWLCPAFGLVIDDGLCWECSMADQGGPADTADDLRRWAAGTPFGTVAGFQAVCAECPHCPWQKPAGGRGGPEC